MTQALTTGKKPAPDLLSEIRTRVPLSGNVTPERALSGVTCALDQHVTGGESRHLFETLPSDVQPLLAPCLVQSSRLPRVAVEHVASQLPEDLKHLWLGPREIAERVGPHDVVEEVENELPPGVGGKRAVAAVMCTLSDRLPLGEAGHLVRSLPDSVQEEVKPCLQNRSERPDPLMDLPAFLARVRSRVPTVQRMWANP